MKTHASNASSSIFCELRPLIFEHEALLRALKDMGELKAEQMLSILTAAETEMYESSKKHEETQ